MKQQICGPPRKSLNLLNISSKHLESHWKVFKFLLDKRCCESFIKPLSLVWSLPFSPHCPNILDLFYWLYDGREPGWQLPSDRTNTSVTTRETFAVICHSHCLAGCRGAVGHSCCGNQGDVNCTCQVVPLWSGVRAEWVSGVCVCAGPSGWVVCVCVRGRVGEWCVCVRGRVGEWCVCVRGRVGEWCVCVRGRVGEWCVCAGPSGWVVWVEQQETLCCHLSVRGDLGRRCRLIHSRQVRAPLMDTKSRLYMCSWGQTQSPAWYFRKVNIRPPGQAETSCTLSSVDA